MEQRAKTLIITGIVALVILGIILGTVYYLGSNLRRRFSGFGANSAPSATPSPTLIPANIEGQVQGVGLKVYSGDGFTLNYPEKWGVLKCSNTANFEFDPINSVDEFGVECDYAQKPITVLVNSGIECTGEDLRIGNTLVRKSKETVAKGVNYRWCTVNTTPGLDVTHRVSTEEARATSKVDFSVQVEQVISSFNFLSGGS